MVAADMAGEAVVSEAVEAWIMGAIGAGLLPTAKMDVWIMGAIAVGASRMEQFATMEIGQEEIGIEDTILTMDTVGATDRDSDGVSGLEIFTATMDILTTVGDGEITDGATAIMDIGGRNMTPMVMTPILILNMIKE
jgi:hypothetical protein